MADVPGPGDRPTDGSCSHWIAADLRYCGEAHGVRRYQPGYRCPDHDIRTLAGLPPLPESPGIPAYRKQQEATAPGTTVPPLFDAA